MLEPLAKLWESERVRRIRNQRAVVLLTRTVRDFGDDECPTLAASMAYYAFFSLFPLMLGLIAVFSLVAEPSTVRERLISLMGAYLPGSSEFVDKTVQEAVKARNPAGIVAIIGLFWSASAFFGSLRQAVNRAWNVEKPRSFLKQKLVEFATMLAVAMLFLLSLASTFVLSLLDNLMSLYLRSGSPFLDEAILNLPLTAIRLLLGLLPIFLTFILFLALYRFIPHAPVRLKDVWLGALVATLLFEVAKRGFVWYLTNFANYNVVYGSLAAVIVLLFWAYISAVILLFGAELASEYSRLYGSRRPAWADEERPERVTGLPLYPG